MDKKWIFGLIFGLSFGALAASPSQDAQCSRRATISPSYSYFSYHEYGTDSQVVDKEQGSLPVLTAELAVPYALPRGYLETRYRVDLSAGVTRYVGALWGDPYGSVRKHTVNALFNLEADVGYVYELTNDLSIQAFAGLGYHNWLRSLQGVGGYDEVYSWFYVPMGLKFGWQVNHCWRMELEGAYLPMFAGKLDVDLGFGTTLNLGSKSGWRLSSTVTYALSDSNWSLGLTPWYTHWELGDSPPGLVIFSDAIIILGEPRSTTDIFGGSFNIAYAF